MIHKRHSIVDLKLYYPEKFGVFVMALKRLIDSDDWARICGIHGDTFKPNDDGVLCPTNPTIVTELGQTGEPFYCKHSVYSFIAWHAPYIFQFELLLNKYNESSDKSYITLPWIDLTDFSADYHFMNECDIRVLYEGKHITTENPLAGAYYYVNGVRTKTTRNGFLSPATRKQRMQLNVVRKELGRATNAPNYEMFSSTAGQKVNYTPLETPHNSLHNIIGGKNGNMTSIDISAFDPMFWFHHCNMDRYYWNWTYEITNKFSHSIYPRYMTDATAKERCAPFGNKTTYSHDWTTYEWGWRNDSNTYAHVFDVIDLVKFPYYYDKIDPVLEKEPLAKKCLVIDLHTSPYTVEETRCLANTYKNTWIELSNIPIPPESVEINAYIYAKDKPLNKETDYAGSAFWFGIDRAKIHCPRCLTGTTNLKIDVKQFMTEMGIDETNLDNYNVLIEGEGMLAGEQENRVFWVYTESELVQNGVSQLVCWV